MNLRRYVYAAFADPEPTQHVSASGSRHARYGPIDLVERAAHTGTNEVTVLGRVSSEELFARADAFFGVPGGYRVTLDAEAAPEVETVLRARGWRLDEEEPALVLQPLRGLTIPAPPPELTIRQVETEADLDAFHALRSPPVRVPRSVAEATAPDVGVFIGSVGGVVVATSRVKVKGAAIRVADVNGVNTLLEARRRGYGTAITWRTVRYAAERGADAAVLTATAMGYPVYLRMGFVPVCTFRTFEPPGRPPPDPLTRVEDTP